jgi:hypothetical protein
MTYEEMVSRMADTTGLTKRLVDKTYKAYWGAIRDYISALPLKQDLTEEEFSKLKPNVNIPSIGKLFLTFERYCRIRKQYSIIQENKNKKYAAHQGD